NVRLLLLHWMVSGVVDQIKTTIKYAAGSGITYSLYAGAVFLQPLKPARPQFLRCGLGWNAWDFSESLCRSTGPPACAVAKHPSRNHSRIRNIDNHHLHTTHGTFSAWQDDAGYGCVCWGCKVA